MRLSEGRALVFNLSVASLLLRPWEFFEAWREGPLPRAGLFFFLALFSGLPDLPAYLRSWRARDLLLPAFALIVLFANALRPSWFAVLPELCRGLFLWIALSILASASLHAGNRRLRFVFVASLLVIVALQALCFTLDPSAHRLPQFARLLDTNDITALMVLGISFVLADTFRVADRRWRLLLSAISISASYLVIWMAQSRGGLVAFHVSLALFSLLLLRRLWQGATLALLILCSTPLFTPTATSRRSQGDTSISAVSHVNYWDAGLSMIKSQPFAGVGYQSFPQVYARDYDHMPWETEQGARDAHSTWIKVAAENGLPALIVLVAALMAALESAWCRRKKDPAPLASILAYSTAISFLSHGYLPYLYLLISVASAPLAERPTASRQRATRPPKR